MENKDKNILTLKRFCGDEHYPVIEAEWYIIDGDGTWDDPTSLWLEMNFGEGNDLHEDTKTLEAEPSWEVSFSNLTLTKEDLKPGLVMGNKNEEQDSEAILYYCEHQPTIDNWMEILEVNGDSLLIKVTGKTMDVNFYDGSKPLNELEVTAWFRHNEE